MNKNSSLIGFALAGMAAGAAVWYLFGTKDGRKNLNKAIEGFGELSSTIKEKASEGMECASDFADKAKRKFEAGKGKFKDATDELRSDIKEKGSRMKESAEELGRKAERNVDNLANTAKNKLNN